MKALSITTAPLVAAALLAAGGCGSDRRAGPGLDTGGDGDQDTDTDSETGSESDTGSEIDTSWSAPPHELEIEWVRCFEESDAGVDRSGNDLTALGDGRIAIAGQFEWAEPTRFLTVLEGDGATAWTAAAAAASENCWARGYSVDGAPGEGVLVAGLFRGEITFGSGESASTLVWDGSDSDVFLARYAGDGTFEWADAFAGEEMTLVGRVASTPDGSTAIAGRMFQNATFDPGGHGETTIPGFDAGYLARFHPGGVFEAAVATPDSSRPYSLVAWPDGRVFLGGCFNGTASIWGEGGPNETAMDAQGSWDVFLAGYSAKGPLSWATSVRGGYYHDWEEVFDMAAADDETFVAVGAYTFAAVFGEGEPDETFVSTGEMANGFLARYRVDGSLVWARGFGGDWDDQARAVTADQDAIYVAGKAGWPAAVFGAGEPNQTVLSIGSDGHWDQLFVAEYGLDGDLEWAGGVPGSSGVLPRGIALAADGGLVLGGFYEGEAALGQDSGGDPVICSADKRRPFVVKYRPSPDPWPDPLALRPGREHL